MAESEDREELLRGPMGERFSLWWGVSEWRSKTHTIREMAIAQDAFAHGWKASAAALDAAINAGIGWGHANALNQDKSSQRWRPRAQADGRIGSAESL